MAPTKEVAALPFALFPNPASTSLTVELTDNEPVRVQLFRTDGQRVVNLRNVRGSRIQLPVATLDPGLYWLTITDANGQRGTQRVIVG